LEATVLEVGSRKSSQNNKFSKPSKLAIGSKKNSVAN
jgi:hypothetical protein